MSSAEIKTVKDGEWKPVGGDNPIPVAQVGSTLQEQQTEADAVAGVLTFAANISTIEIYNTDAVNAGTFEVNGVTIHVPASGYFKSNIGGVPAATVTITGATTYVVNRYT